MVKSITVLFLSFIFIPSLSLAGSVSQVTSKVSYIRNYTIEEHKGLDIQVNFDVECPGSSSGFYLEKSGDSETALSLLLTALAAEKEVVIHYEANHQPNFASALDFCRIYSVGLKR
ncbi:hypothetical protein MED121_13215 [Marinomonas sp. MED121]|uniref:hypothetical protein n=1 Tax=Marinomonas sp. MED121 TaxID=314277 RepID=UPI000068FFD4|nr:hypothetical protein [Marinomonas sp. MED121]EAQ66889.1 hypothetical protein MED121_13215 [Marinomonas sp. MED121]